MINVNASSLLADPTFMNHYERVLETLQKPINNTTIDASHEEYHLILKSNEYSSYLDKE